MRSGRGGGVGVDRFSFFFIIDVVVFVSINLEFGAMVL